ncbi:hypothetical protein L6452_23262 [Arctium lappa]|uniref:Uncharacterized protein n=1 Tax=Arctium lappa TaxID=4217 RepID=A0ACB9B2G1_ARCLA|nr:hypothetical protein L6452_23262 [Arctium lappa]
MAFNELTSLKQDIFDVLSDILHLQIQHLPHNTHSPKHKNRLEKEARNSRNLSSLFRVFKLIQPKKRSLLWSSISWIHLIDAGNLIFKDIEK